jgi:hypothetical protein
MRDFFDVRALAAREAFDGRTIARAIRTTFEKRSVPIPEAPLALTLAFAEVEGKHDQWNGFLRKSALPPVNFADVISDVSQFLLPVIGSLSVDSAFDKNWPPGGPWR